MKKLILLFTLLNFSLMAEDSKFYNFEMNTIEGKNVKLDKYKGKVLMVVNVASRCGLTKQYTALQKLYTEYKEKGFEIVAFPCNDFRGQEPGSDKEILAFCQSKYNVTFNMMSKIHVLGDKQHPLYKFLTSAKGEGPIKWNFEKFIISKTGDVVGRFSPRTKPDDKKIKDLITAEVAK